MARKQNVSQRITVLSVIEVQVDIKNKLYLYQSFFPVGIRGMTVRVS